MARSWESLIQETRVKEHWLENFPSLKKDFVREHLGSFNAWSMGPDGMCPQVLRELVDVTAGPLMVVFEMLQRTGEVPKYWKRVHVPLVFKTGKEDPGKYQQSA